MWGVFFGGRAPINPSTIEPSRLLLSLYFTSPILGLVFSFTQKTSSGVQKRKFDDVSSMMQPLGLKFPEREFLETPHRFINMGP